MTTGIDYTALTEPYDPKAGAALAARLRSSVPTERTFVGMGVAVDIIGAIGLGFGVIILGPIGIIALIQSAMQGSWEGIGIAAIILVAALGMAAFVYWLLHRYFRRTGSPELWWRLDRFAHANGLLFSPWSKAPAFASVMFHTGANTATYNHVRRDGDGFFNIGNLYYQTGAKSMESVDHRWGFVAIQLAQKWPSALLDAKANNRLGMNGLPFDLSDNQPLALTGAAAEAFVLWGQPSDHERLAKVFTPTFTDALSSGRGAYDAHLVDDWLFVFSRGEFTMTDPALLAELFGFVDLVRAEGV